MVRILPSKPRWTVSTADGVLRITIPVRRRLVLVLPFAFFVLWFFGVIVHFMIQAMVTGDFSDAWLNLVFMGLFVIPMLTFLLGLCLWGLWGREIIMVTPELLSVRSELFGYGRTRDFELPHITDLRVLGNCDVWPYGNTSFFSHGQPYRLRLWGRDSPLRARLR